MFLVRRPSSPQIARFIDGSRALPLSYQPEGLARGGADGFRVDEQIVPVGSGTAAFARAVTALMEWVPLLSGLEQGVALPSLNWLVGVRTASGAEFGIGPNITPVGTGLVVAAGMTVRYGALNVPLNFAVASSKSGVRISIMTGFNIRR